MNARGDQRDQGGAKASQQQRKQRPQLRPHKVQTPAIPITKSVLCAHKKSQPNGARAIFAAQNCWDGLDVDIIDQHYEPETAVAAMGCEQLHSCDGVYECN